MKYVWVAKHPEKDFRGSPIYLDRLTSTTVNVYGAKQFQTKEACEAWIDGRAWTAVEHCFEESTEATMIKKPLWKEKVEGLVALASAAPTVDDRFVKELRMLVEAINKDLDIDLKIETRPISKDGRWVIETRLGAADYLILSDDRAASATNLLQDSKK